MALNSFLQRSVKTRVTLFTLVIFVLGLWLLSFYASRMLRGDMERLLGEQQFSTASYIAAEVNQGLGDRLKALEKVAGLSSAAMEAGTVAIQKLIDDRPILQELFNGGITAYGPDGTAVADFPLATGRVGVNYMDFATIAAALKEGRATIDRPVIGRKLLVPVVRMAAPIRNAQGQVIGALAGVINLTKPSFLDRVSERLVSKTGSYLLLISPSHQMIVSATDKGQIMSPLHAPTNSPGLDRFLQGYEGSLVTRNLKGIEVLASARGVPVAGWLVVLALPTTEAFAPIQDMQRRMLLATSFLTLLAGILTWWMLRRQLSPLLLAAHTLATRSDANEPLPVIRQDEIGELIGGFNRLLETLEQREDSLKVSQENLTITLHSIGDAVIATDAAGRITRMNPTAERLSGWAGADAMHRPLAEVFRIVNADTREPVADPALQVMASGKVVGLASHTLLLAKDGREYRIADSAAPIRNGAGEFLGVVLVFSDVTDKHRAAEELLQAQATLQAAMDASPAGIAIADAPSGKLRFVNDAGLSLVGGDRQTLLTGVGVEENVAGWKLFDLDGRPLESDEAPLARALMFGETSSREFVIRRKEGDDRTVLGNAAPIRSASGKVVAGIVVFTDISDRKQAELELTRYRLHLEELVAARTSELAAARNAADAGSRAKTAFLANMSHEIRTPMNAIIGLTHLLRRSGPTPEQAERLEKIEVAGQHLLSIINSILDLSKIEAGKLQLQQEAFSLSGLLDNVRSMMLDSARAKGLSVEVDGDAAPQWLHGDATRLRQALLNFAGNAVKFTDQGTIVLRARLLAERGDELLVRFEVADTGIGIAPDKLKRLFTAFEQGDTSITREYGGTGLGLAITQRLAQLMGGDAGADSTPGAGSTFWFTARLQRGLGVTLPVPAPDIADAEQQLRDHCGHARLLLAEDNAINREVAVELLHGAGLAVDTAGDGLEAVAKARATSYDLILMDMQMPNMGGLEATRALRGLPGYAQVPILAMTANAFAEDRRACAEAGMDDYVAKPVEPGKLFSTLLKWLRRR